MEYIKIKFTLGLDCEAYQEVRNGDVLRYLDLDGNELTLPDVTESHVIETESFPVWSQ